jgi:hypothetical protein
MANQGRQDANGSVFRIITSPQPDWDGKNVVFGRVVRGQWLVRELEGAATDEQMHLFAPYLIYNSGQLPDDVEDDGYLAVCGGDPYANWPEDNVVDTPLTIGDYLRISEELKSMGTGYLQSQDYFRACRKYEKSIRYVEAGLTLTMAEEDGQDGRISKQLYDVKVACYLNISLCHFRRKKPHLVKFECTKILEELQPLEPIYRIKALYRRAMAQIEDSQLAEAMEDLRLAHQLDGGRDPAVTREYHALNARLWQQKHFERNAYRKLFTSPTQPSPPTIL